MDINEFNDNKKISIKINNDKNEKQKNLQIIDKFDKNIVYLKYEINAKKNELKFDIKMMNMIKINKIF